VRSKLLLESGNLSRLTLWWVTMDRLLKATSTPSSKIQAQKPGWEGQKKGSCYRQRPCDTHTHKKMSGKTDIHESNKNKDSTTSSFQQSYKTISYEVIKATSINHSHASPTTTAPRSTFFSCRPFSNLLCRHFQRPFPFMLEFGLWAAYFVDPPLAFFSSGDYSAALLDDFDTV